MKPSLLVVEDDEDLAETLRVRLEGSGYRVTLAATQAEGLAAVRSRRPDVAILDILLPDGNGLDLLARIRKDPQLADLPVVLLTGLGAVSQIENGFLSGANAYIPKPYDPGKLVMAVEFLVAESGGRTRH